MQTVLIDRETIHRRVQELGAAISRDYAGDELIMVVVLKGAAVFMADLLRAITIPVSIEFVEFCSYDGSRSTGQITVVKDVQASVTGKNLLIVEDIVDTGVTLSFLAGRLRSRDPKSLRICALLSKPDSRQVKVAVDYLGFSIPNEFVIGYGLDYNGRFRNLPEIVIWQDNM